MLLGLRPTALFESRVVLQRLARCPQAFQKGGVFRLQALVAEFPARQAAPAAPIAEALSTALEHAGDGAQFAATPLASRSSSRRSRPLITHDSRAPSTARSSSVRSHCASTAYRNAPMRLSRIGSLGATGSHSASQRRCSPVSAV